MATILLAGVDPIFAGQLGRLLAGHHLIEPESVDEPDLVVADIGRVEPDEVSDAYPAAPILGYFSHADPVLLRAAQEAGFDRVVDRSALAENLELLISELSID